MVGANGMTKHLGSCITSLMVFLEQHAGVLTFDPSTNCLIWSGRLANGGYARLGDHRRVTRVLLELFLERSLTPVEYACHTCDTPPCVNWLRLWPGTAKDNALDMLAKGRQRGGPNAPGIVYKVVP